MANNLWFMFSVLMTKINHSMTFHLVVILVVTKNISGFQSPEAEEHLHILWHVP